MTDRSAVDTIRGYFYQFDYSILSVLKLSGPEQSIAIECIEDIEINTLNEVTAIQCKYYAGTEYNHSVIKPAIRHMLSHFKTSKDEGKPIIRYTVHGHYRAGQHKLPNPIDIEFLKQHFLTYKTKSIEWRHHEVLGLTDSQLNEFLGLLDLNINAASFETQFAEIINALKDLYRCTPFEAEYFYYNNAIATIRELSLQPNMSNRTITRREFLSRIDTSGVLFNEWFVQKKGRREHFMALRREYFTALNTSPFERFFLLESDPAFYLRSDLKKILFLISEKWSKTSRRDGPLSFCPYVYVHGIHVDELTGLKSELQAEQFRFIDGHDYHASSFNANSITRQATHENGIKLKVLNSITDLEATLGIITKTREVYQFHLNQI